MQQKIKWNEKSCNCLYQLFSCTTFNMKLVTFIVLIFSLFVCDLFSDASPRLNEKPEIEFWKDGNRLELIDSILVVTTIKSDILQIDSLYIDNEYQGFEKNRLWEHNGRIRIDLRTKIESYKIYLLYNNKEYVSEQLRYKGVRNFFRFILTDEGDIENDHPLFYAKWFNYFKSLFITIILELILAFILLRNISISKIKLIFLIVMVNIITHPSLWYLNSHFNISIINLEIGVIISEVIILAYLLKQKVKLRSLLVYSLSANLISWLVGAVLYWII